NTSSKRDWSSDVCSSDLFQVHRSAAALHHIGMEPVGQVQYFFLFAQDGLLYPRGMPNIHQLNLTDQDGIIRLSGKSAGLLYYFGRRTDRSHYGRFLHGHGYDIGTIINHEIKS